MREEYRQQGYARLLVEKCEQWAKHRGCLEFASDCEWDNDESLRVHLQLGFTEANRIICFTKIIKWLTKITGVANIAPVIFRHF